MRCAAVILLAAGLAVTATGYDFAAVDSLLSDSLSRLGGGCALLLDISGRKALDLQPGENGISRLSPGVYSIRTETGNGTIKTDAEEQKW